MKKETACKMFQSNITQRNKIKQREKKRDRKLEGKAFK